MRLPSLDGVSLPTPEGSLVRLSTIASTGRLVVHAAPVGLLKREKRQWESVAPLLSRLGYRLLIACVGKGDIRARNATVVIDSDGILPKMLGVRVRRYPLLGVKVDPVTAIIVRFFDGYRVVSILAGREPGVSHPLWALEEARRLTEKDVGATL